MREVTYDHYTVTCDHPKHSRKRWEGYAKSGSDPFVTAMRQHEGLRQVSLMNKDGKNGRTKFHIKTRAA